MIGRRQLRMLVQWLTFLVSGLALILGVATAYSAATSGSPADDEHELVPADVSEDMGETSDTLDAEDELNGWPDHHVAIALRPAPLSGVVGLALAERILVSPFLDPLLRPPCLA